MSALLCLSECASIVEIRSNVAYSSNVLELLGVFVLKMAAWWASFVGQELEYIVPNLHCFWQIISADLVIGQVLMRSLKTTRGLTRGRGMGDKQRNRWLLAMPACGEVNNMIQKLTNKRFNMTEQHKDMSETRRVKDHNNVMELFTFRRDHNLFESKGKLHNIATRITGILIEQ